MIARRRSVLLLSHVDHLWSNIRCLSCQGTSEILCTITSTVVSNKVVTVSRPSLLANSQRPAANPQVLQRPTAYPQVPTVTQALKGNSATRRYGSSSINSNSWTPTTFPRGRPLTWMRVANDCFTVSNTSLAFCLETRACTVT